MVSDPHMMLLLRIGVISETPVTLSWKHTRTIYRELPLGLDSPSIMPSFCGIHLLQGKFASETYKMSQDPGWRVQHLTQHWCNLTQSVTVWRKVCICMKACDDICGAWSWPDTVPGCIFPEFNGQGWLIANMSRYLKKKNNNQVY